MHPVNFHYIHNRLVTVQSAVIFFSTSTATAVENSNILIPNKTCIAKVESEQLYECHQLEHDA